VVDREPPHGEIDSTAADRYDFSNGFGLFPGADSIFLSLARRRASITPEDLIQWKAESDLRNVLGGYFATNVMRREKAFI
jgi:hypothetical protein